MKLLFLLLMFFCIQKAWTQQYDHSWLIGYADSTPEPNDHFGISEILFGQFGKLDTIDNFASQTFFDGTNVSISDSLGNLLFYFDGFNVYDATHNIMANGDSLSRTFFSGSNVFQGAVILQNSEIENLYTLFHIDGKYVDENIGYVGTHVYKSDIDLSLNNGLGAVVKRKQIILQDDIYYGRISAVKHANGKDWWVLTPNQIDGYATGIYSILYNSQKEVKIDFHDLDQPIVSGLGQSVISPDGKQFAISNAHSLNANLTISLCQIDRCTGEVFNCENKVLPVFGVYATGVGFSSNSRLLYVTASDKIFQFDTYEVNPLEKGSLVATYDGFLDSLFPVPTKFYLCQLAPDGKIYISIPNGARFLHYIDFPNRFGSECNVIQHGLQLPNFNGGSLPSFPNYRLGPVDGSICDSLNINNLPSSNFRIDNNFTKMNYDFTDLSSYAPESWHWDFGDGNFSFEINPTHTYNQNGIYYVCLTVTNQFGWNTSCDSLIVDGITSIKTINGPLISIFPNPCNNYVIVELEDKSLISTNIEIYNLLGHKVLKECINSKRNLFYINNLTNGVYIIKISDRHSIHFSSLIIKI